jgi:hypothetical protein
LTFLFDVSAQFLLLYQVEKDDDDDDDALLQFINEELVERCLLIK